MKLIKVSELQLNDEIIISGHSSLKYLKVLYPPKPKGRKAWKMDNSTGEWNQNGEDLYKSARCTVRQDSYEYKNKYSGVIRKKYFYVYEPDISKHNKKISIDLNSRDILLVKRHENN